MAATHEVLNQRRRFVDRDLFAIDPALQDAVARNGAEWARAE